MGPCRVATGRIGAARPTKPTNAPAVIEVIFRDASNLVGTHGALLIQVRSGHLTRETIDRCLAERARLRDAGHKVPMLAILEEGTPIPSREVRAYQKQVLGADTFDDGPMAVAILGSSPVTTLLRTAARTNTLVRDRVRITSTLEAACRFLAEHTELSAAELRAAAEEARARHREALARGPALDR